MSESSQHGLISEVTQLSELGALVDAFLEKRTGCERDVEYDGSSYCLGSFLFIFLVFEVCEVVRTIVCNSRRAPLEVIGRKQTAM